MHFSLAQDELVSVKKFMFSHLSPMAFLEPPLISQNQKPKNQNLKKKLQQQLSTTQTMTMKFTMSTVLFSALLAANPASNKLASAAGLRGKDDASLLGSFPRDPEDNARDLQTFPSCAAGDKLEVKFVRGMDQIYNDKGTGVDGKFSAWRADQIDGWYFNG